MGRKNFLEYGDTLFREFQTLLSKEVLKYFVFHKSILIEIEIELQLNCLENKFDEFAKSQNLPQKAHRAQS